MAKKTSNNQMFLLLCAVVVAVYLYVRSRRPVTIPLPAPGADERTSGGGGDGTPTPEPQEPEETAIRPAWLQALGLTIDANSRDASWHVQATTSNVQMKIEALSGAQPSGITRDGVVWNGGVYMPGFTTWVIAPNNKIFPTNPVASGIGGLVPGATYKVTLKNLNSPDTVFVINVTIPGTSVFETPHYYTLPEEEGDPEEENPTDPPEGPEETTVAPAWLQALGLTIDANSRDSSWHVQASTNNVHMKIEALSGAQPNGITRDGVAWNGGVYMPGFTTWTIAPNNKIFPTNPVASGIGGLVPGATYKVTLKNLNSPDTVFVINVTIPGTSVFEAPHYYTLPEEEGEPEEGVEYEGLLLSSNPGASQKVVGECLYEFCDNEDFQIVINDVTGRVRLVGPATKRSRDNTRDCHPYFYDDHHKPVKAEELEALLGSDGLDFPCGQHSWCVMWAATSAPGMYETVEQDNWSYFSNEYMYDKSARPNMLYLSKVSLEDDTQSGVIKEPRDIRRFSWLPHYQLLPFGLNLPADQDFGVTRLIWTPSAGLNSVLDKGIRVQYAYGELDHVPPSKRWTNIRAYVGGGIGTPQQIADQNWTGPDQLDTAECAENMGNAGVSNFEAKSEEVWEIMDGKYMGGDGTENHRGHGDYFQAIQGKDNNISANSESAYRNLMSSQAEARKRRAGEDLVTSSYFSGPYNHRHWMQGGYLDSIVRGINASWVYYNIMQMERKYMAAPDRRVLMNSWSQYEGVNADTIRSGAAYRQRFPGGYLIRRDVLGIGYETMRTQTFWCLLLKGRYVMWHSNIRLSDNLYKIIPTGVAGGDGTHNYTFWQPDGGGVVQYNPGNPDHPQVQSAGVGSFPVCPHTGESGAFAGAWLYSQIAGVKDYVSNGISYAEFSFTINGGATQNGYNGTNVPRTGPNGAKLSMPGAANPGQDNIATTMWHKKPICLYASGEDGHIIIYQNPMAGIADSQTVTVANNGGKTFTIVGNTVNIIKY